MRKENYNTYDNEINKNKVVILRIYWRIYIDIVPIHT